MRSVRPTSASTSACAGVGRFDGARHQRRRLALAQVAADRLAGDGRVAERTHHVVAHLERIAQRQAVRAERRQQLVGTLGRGHHRAEVQRTLDGVLAALVAADLLGLVAAALVAHAAHDVEHLTDVELDAQLVPDRPRLRRRRRPSACRRRRTPGRRPGWRRPRRSGAPRRPSRRRGGAGRTRCGWWGCRAGWRRRPSRRRGTARTRASARTRHRRSPPSGRRGRRRRRRSPSGRTPAAAACRRPAPDDRSRPSARPGRRRRPPSGRARARRNSRSRCSTRAAMAASDGGAAGELTRGRLRQRRANDDRSVAAAAGQKNVPQRGNGRLANSTSAVGQRTGATLLRRGRSPAVRARRCRPCTRRRCR